LFRSLQSKLILSFLLVALTGIAILAAISYQTTTSGFDEYVTGQGIDTMLSALEQHFRENGTLHGYRNSLTLESPPGAEWERVDPTLPFIVTDPYGRPVDSGPQPSDPGHSEPGRSYSSEAIVVDGELAGYLLYEERPPVVFNRLDQQFMQRITDTLWKSALGAVVVAIVLGFLLARSLTGTLTELHRATQAMSEGDLVQRVPVRSQDELGELAASFNRMNARLQRMLQQREQMTADIAHELRTPLSVIIGHTAAGMEGVLPIDKDMLGVIDEEAHRLKRLVEDLRTLSLAEAGELALDQAPTDIPSLMEGCAAAFQPAAMEKKVAIDVDIEDDLPEMLMDPLRMKQVIDNLLDNALRYSPDGGTIRLAAAAAGDSLRIDVADSGKGIPPDEMDHIFDRLYRVDDARTRMEGGSGLGLAIAKSLVENHGGSIHVESAPGDGATFIVLLPIIPPSHTA